MASNTDPHKVSGRLGVSNSESKIFSIARPCSDCFCCCHPPHRKDARHPAFIPLLEDQRLRDKKWKISHHGWKLSPKSRNWFQILMSLGEALGTISDNHIPRHSMCLPTFGYFFGKFSLTHHTLSV